MKKICLTVIGLYILMLHAFSQTTKKDSTITVVKDTPSVYIFNPLKLEDINLVSSYYNQNGNHSAITGGIGTELVTDISNGIELKYVGSDNEGYKYTLNAGLGIDYHSSASSAFVNKSGASSQSGTRIYPSLSYSEENERGTVKGVGLYYSSEFNYHSFGIDANYSQKVGNGGEVSAKISGYFDKVKLIYPSELRPSTVVVTSASGSAAAIPTSPRNTFTGSLSYNQIINKNIQASLLLDLVAQNGLLSLPFHRVYFVGGAEQVESLPSSRYKLPIGFRLNYFIGDKIILRSYYRYYTDNWGITAHTASLEMPIKVTPFFSVSPFYRFYTQTASTYFAPYEMHKATDAFFTSNYSYSAFSSNYFGAGIRVAPPGGVWKSAISALEIRFGHYTQTTALYSNVLSINLEFKQ